MGNGHTPKPSLLKKVIKGLNPFDPVGLAVDLLTAGGRPTAGASLPGIGPNIQANSDEAMAEELRKRLKEWDVGDLHAYLKHIRDAQKQGLEGDEAIERAKETFKDKVKYQKSSRNAEPQPQTQPFPQPLPPKPEASPSHPSPVTKPNAAPEAPAPSTGAEGGSFPMPLPPKPEAAPQPEQRSDAPTDPRTASMLTMAKAPIADAGLAPLVKDTATWTEAEMRQVLDKAQAGFTRGRSGDPLKAHSYERVQDWHVGIYGDDPQGNDGGKPIEPKPIRPIPTAESPARTPDGEDLFAASGRIAGKVADAAGSLGHADAVKALQGGLNLLGTGRQLPARSPAYGPYTKQAPLAEDGEYGPKTDFALKQSLGRHGAAKVDEAFALGRFGQFARVAQSRRDPAGLEGTVHGALGPLFRKGGDGPKVEGGVLQDTLNQVGGDRFDDWQELKVDDWVGPKTTAAFGRVLEAEDADQVTRRFGRNLGLL